MMSKKCQQREMNCEPVGQPRSLLPLPKPFCTGPDNSMGKGGSGQSGPTINGRMLRTFSGRDGASGCGATSAGIPGIVDV